MGYIAYVATHYLSQPLIEFLNEKLQIEKILAENIDEKILFTYIENFKEVCVRRYGQDYSKKDFINVVKLFLKDTKFFKTE